MIFHILRHPLKLFAVDSRPVCQPISRYRTEFIFFAAKIFYIYIEAVAILECYLYILIPLTKHKGTIDKSLSIDGY
jgi:hypothetical protein